MTTLLGVAGLINDEDLAAVRERSRIEDVVGSYVTLRRDGSDSMGGRGLRWMRCNRWRTCGLRWRQASG